jgi:hypothetical protein
MSPHDALDPGPDGSYPFMPRKPDGSVDRERMPTGLTRNVSADGEVRLIDLTPRDAGGKPIDPPPLPPGGPGV